MIRNILFDMGGVLIQYDPRDFLRRIVDDPQDRELLYREIYGAANWVAMDRGRLTEKEALESFCAHLPERLHETAHTLVYNWVDYSRNIDGMEELVQELSQCGYRLCVMSNASLRHHEYWPAFPISRYFGNRIMLSADWHLVKPDLDFFAKACELLSVKPEESIFIDDSPANIEAAHEFGMDGVVFFNDVPRLRRELHERGII